MSEDTIFIGQPLLSQMASFLDKRDVMRMSRSHGGERYVKSFDGWQHPTVVRILLMCHVNVYAFFEYPEKRWETILSSRSPGPPEPDLFSWRGLENQK